MDLQSKWGKWASSNAQGPRRTRSGPGKVLSLSLSAYGNMNPDSALAAWKWIGHIWKQMTLIKICLGMWERENINVLKRLFTEMLIQPLVA